MSGDVTVGFMLTEIIKGLSISVGLFAVLVIGARGLWLYPREYAALNASWQKRWDDQIVYHTQTVTRLEQQIVHEREQTMYWKSFAERATSASETNAIATARTAVAAAAVVGAKG